MSEKIKFKMPEQGEGGNGKVRKFFGLNAFYYPDERKIVVNEGEYEVSFGESLKMLGAVKHAQTAENTGVPEFIVDAARKKAGVVLKIVRGGEKKDLIRGAEREAWKEADRTGIDPEEYNQK